MVTTSDFVSLSYSRELTQAGTAYACRSLAYTYNPRGGEPYDRLRRIVSSVMFELAFRRYLSEREIPFTVFRATPFTAPDRYQVVLGGRRCDLKSGLIIQRDRIRQVRRSPERLLDAPALVPTQQVTGGHMRAGDLYIFAFLTALITQTTAELDRALAAGQPHSIVHCTPQEWSHPLTRRSLSPLVVKSDTTTAVGLTLAGQAQGGGFLHVTLNLPPLRRQPVEGDFITLDYLKTESPPDGMIGVYSPALGETYLVDPQSWGNIWVYGLEIILVGYIPCGEFRRWARRVESGNQVFPYTPIQVENLALPVRSLRPISDLLARVRHWRG